MTEEAREAAIDSYHDTHPPDMAAGYRALLDSGFAAGFDAGVAEGRRQAREAVAGELLATDLEDVRKPDVIWRDDALSAIDALTTRD
ncbi:hypothetical protein [Agromyces cerinus]|uniref:Uncharacterized protein n=1 Tax=Agromyces cerinus subsp. cerinus TaxID=232089 RepID=A0A1N6DPD4_9MICO|nr:hypothetical protein [Agromyces cerinus]SIN72669.1 hypothetical protein SAMN05443544_0559 [Agromyces cerinus subsp. cerinus]